MMILTGCSIYSTEIYPLRYTATISPTQYPSLQPAATIHNTPIVSPTRLVSHTPTSTPDQKNGLPVRQQICSPMENILLSDLPGYVVNPYHPPQAGSDDPHHGTDFADQQPGTTIAVSGLPVHAILPGKVAGIISDRFPYGNAVIIESPIGLVNIDPEIIPEVMPTLSAYPALTCPPLQGPLTLDEKKQSFYLLYAHLQSQPTMTIGDEVSCGQNLGVIGESGNALNPHLHLEIRIGPGGARFPSMAHYDNSASTDEMAFYCLWRISGLFQTIDPMKVLVMP